MKISASVWSSDLTNLGADIKRVENYCDYFHFDIMDGHYVKNIIFGPDLVKSLKPLTCIPFDIHLMVKNPEIVSEWFIDAGADCITFHPETCKNIEKFIYYLKDRSIKIGLALKVDENPDSIFDYLSFIDIVVIMGTDIGVKGLPINTLVYDKIKIIRKIIDSNNYKIQVHVDGGIREDVVPKLFDSGVDTIVAGSLLYKSDLSYIFNWIGKL